MAEYLSFGVQNFTHVQVSENQAVIESNREFYTLYHCYMGGPAGVRKRKMLRKMMVHRKE